MLNCEHTGGYGVFNIMRNRLFIILAVLFFTALSPTAWPLTKSGFGNPAIRRPVGPATVPQSSIRSGLFPSRNPIDTTGNLVITGNVAGGKHFQGVVPYNAISDFAGTAGSIRQSGLDSFLRRSAGTGASGIQPGGYTPYYSPTGTVTTTRAGRFDVFRPPTAKIEGRAAEGFAVPAGLRDQTLTGLEMGVSGIRYRPMRFSPQQLEKLILDGVLTYAEAKRLVDEQNPAQMQRLQRDLQQLQYRAPPLRQSLIVRDDPLRPFSKLEQAADALQPFELQKPEEPPSEDMPWRSTRDKGRLSAKGGLTDLRKQEQLGVYERMKRQIDNMQTGYSILDTRNSKQTPSIEGEEPKGAKSQEQPEKEKSLPGTLDLSLERPATDDTQRDELTGLALSVRAQSILGEHKTFASYSNDKFNQHMRAAEKYLKQGKYYRAADTYTLASIYKPNDPLAYAGKSHALFAAGGYMSSALFLSRALEIFPEYARFKIDLAAMVGDRDKVESRIADIKQWLEKSGAAELQFLLAYVYYQMGRVGEAQKAIDAAYEKLPPTASQSEAKRWGRAVAVLKKAIDGAAAGNQPAIK